MITYFLDPNDCIVGADEEWDAFARLNKGPLKDAVIGRPLWSQFADANTRQIWRHLIERVRAGHPVEVTIRCDAPAVRRTVRLAATAAAAGVVRFESRVVEEVDRSPIVLLDPDQPRGQRKVTLCSWCHAVRRGATWEPLEVAAGREDLFDAPQEIPAITHGICGTCEQGMEL